MDGYISNVPDTGMVVSPLLKKEPVTLDFSGVKVFAKLGF